MNVARPELHNVPETLPFNHDFTVPVVIPPGLKASDVQGKFQTQTLINLQEIDYFF